jgi:hypothetical protein
MTMKRRRRSAFGSPRHVMGLLSRLTITIRGFLTQFHARKGTKSVEEEPEESSKQKSSFVMQQKHLNTNYTPLITSKRKETRNGSRKMFLFSIRSSRPCTKHIIFFVVLCVLLKVSTENLLVPPLLPLTRLDRK